MKHGCNAFVCWGSFRALQLTGTGREHDIFAHSQLTHLGRKVHGLDQGHHH